MNKTNKKIALTAGVAIGVIGLGILGIYLIKKRDDKR